MVAVVPEERWVKYYDDVLATSEEGAYKRLVADYPEAAVPEL